MQKGVINMTNQSVKKINQSIISWVFSFCVLQGGAGGGNQSFSDVAKYSFAQLTDRDNLPEGIDLKNKEVGILYQVD